MFLKIASALVATFCLIASASQNAAAQEASDANPAPAKKERNFAIYGGWGSSNEDTDFRGYSEFTNTPWSVGVYGGEKYIFGVELAGEGTKFDSTSGRDNFEKQALSYNFILGANALKNDDFKVDLGAIVGARETTESCPSGQSYLGYQCYADTPPSATYDINYGAIMTLSYKMGLIGVRATGESTQIILGLRF